MVELAVVFPVILTFFLSQIYILQLVIVGNCAENAAYVGARQGIIVGSTNARIVSAVQDELERCLIRESLVSVERDGVGVTVRVEVPLIGNSWVSTQFNPALVSVSRTCTLRVQE